MTEKVTLIKTPGPCCQIVFNPYAVVGANLANAK